MICGNHSQSIDMEIWKLQKRQPGPVSLLISTGSMMGWKVKFFSEILYAVTLRFLKKVSSFCDFNS